MITSTFQGFTSAIQVQNGKSPKPTAKVQVRANGDVILRSPRSFMGKAVSWVKSFFFKPRDPKPDRDAFLDALRKHCGKETGEKCYDAAFNGVGEKGALTVREIERAVTFLDRQKVLAQNDAIIAHFKKDQAEYKKNFRDIFSRKLASKETALKLGESTKQFMLGKEGLIRVPGCQSKMQEMGCSRTCEFKADHSPHDLAALLVRNVHHVLTPGERREYKAVVDKFNNPDSKLSIKEIRKELPEPLRQLFDFAKMVREHEVYNKMNFEAIYTCLVMTTKTPGEQPLVAALTSADAKENLSSNASPADVPTVQAYPYDGY